MLSAGIANPSTLTTLNVPRPTHWHTCFPLPPSHTDTPRILPPQPICPQLGIRKLFPT